MICSTSTASSWYQAYRVSGSAMPCILSPGTYIRFTLTQRLTSRCFERFWNIGRSHVRRLTRGTATSESGSGNSNSSSIVRIHSSISPPSDGCIDYARSWAWQQALLGRRLALRRRRKEAPSLYTDIVDEDSVLLFEHNPVYTLGRGASEDHLTFLQDGTEECQVIRSKLSRKVPSSSIRGKSARLAMNKPLNDEILLQNPVEDVVELLSTIACPVQAPNGVPIYRVDRGGEVTFHGPNQLVVYPNFDLRRPPFQQDLHWYLRMVEEVVIQTLKNFEIESERDEINTGVLHEISVVAEACYSKFLNV